MLILNKNKNIFIVIQLFHIKNTFEINVTFLLNLL